MPYLILEGPSRKSGSRFGPQNGPQNGPPLRVGNEPKPFVSLCFHSSGLPEGGPFRDHFWCHFRVPLFRKVAIFLLAASILLCGLVFISWRAKFTLKGWGILYYYSLFYNKPSINQFRPGPAKLKVQKIWKFPIGTFNSIIGSSAGLKVCGLDSLGIWRFETFAITKLSM